MKQALLLAILAVSGQIQTKNKKQVRLIVKYITNRQSESSLGNQSFRVVRYNTSAKENAVIYYLAHDQFRHLMLFTGICIEQ